MVGRTLARDGITGLPGAGGMGVVRRDGRFVAFLEHFGLLKSTWARALPSAVSAPRFGLPAPDARAIMIGGFQ